MTAPSRVPPTFVARSRGGFHGQNLSLPIAVQTPATVHWQWSAHAKLHFAITFKPKPANATNTGAPSASSSANPSDHVRYTRGINHDSGVELLMASPTGGAPASAEPVVLRNLISAKDSSCIEIEGQGELLFTWEHAEGRSAASKLLFGEAEAEIKYVVSVTDTQLLREERERLRNRATELELLKVAKIASLRRNAADDGRLAMALRRQSDAASAEAAEIEPELEKLQAPFDAQREVVERELAKLERLALPLQKLKARSLSCKARSASLSERAQNAASWGEMKVSEAMRYSTGEWVFIGLKGGGVSSG